MYALVGSTSGLQWIYDLLQIEVNQQVTAICDPRRDPKAHSEQLEETHMGAHGHTCGRTRGRGHGGTCVSPLSRGLLRFFYRTFQGLPQGHLQGLLPRTSQGHPRDTPKALTPKGRTKDRPGPLTVATTRRRGTRGLPLTHVHTIGETWDTPWDTPYGTPQVLPMVFLE